MITAITIMPMVSARSARLRAASKRRAVVGSPGGFGISDRSTLLIVGDAEASSFAIKSEAGSSQPANLPQVVVVRVVEKVEAQGQIFSLELVRKRRERA